MNRVNVETQIQKQTSNGIVALRTRHNQLPNDNLEGCNDVDVSANAGLPPSLANRENTSDCSICKIRASAPETTALRQELVNNNLISIRGNGAPPRFCYDLWVGVPQKNSPVARALQSRRGPLAKREQTASSGLEGRAKSTCLLYRHGRGLTHSPICRALMSANAWPDAI